MENEHTKCWMEAKQKWNRLTWTLLLSIIIFDYIRKMEERIRMRTKKEKHFYMRIIHPIESTNTYVQSSMWMNGSSSLYWSTWTRKERKPNWQEDEQSANKEKMVKNEWRRLCDDNRPQLAFHLNLDKRIEWASLCVWVCKCWPEDNTISWHHSESLFVCMRLCWPPSRIEYRICGKVI